MSAPLCCSRRKPLEPNGLELPSQPESRLEQRPVVALEPEHVAAGAGREVGDDDRRRADVRMDELDRVAAAPVVIVLAEER